MTRKGLRFLAVISVGLLLSTASVYAQNVHSIVADIPYTFSFGGASLPAGSYRFNLSDDHKAVTVIDAKTGKSMANALVVTEIAEASTATDPHVTLDVSGENYSLSEVHFPGHGGVLISGYRTDIPHEHRVVKAKSAKTT